MKQDRFVERYAGEWRALAGLLEGLEGGGGAAGADAATLPRRYRCLTQHLALARARGYSIGLVERLESLAFRGHQLLYQHREPFAAACVRYLALEFPVRLRRAGTRVAAAAAVFFGAMLVAGGIVAAEPRLVTTVLDPADVRSLESMYAGEGRLGRERGAGDDFAMFGFYVRNNIGIGFQTFAGGLAVGLGTLAFLLLNGLHIGAAAGYLTAAGYGTPFWSFVSGHSALELSAIVISGAAGLHVGWALLHPGQLPRGRALVRSARQAVRIMYGAAALFLLAALVEAYWSSQVAVSPLVKYGFGVLGWVVLAAYVGFGGRGREHLVAEDE